MADLGLGDSTRNGVRVEVNLLDRQVLVYVSLPWILAGLGIFWLLKWVIL